MRRLIMIAVLVGSVMTLPAKSLRQMWLELPDSMMPYLTKVLRLEMVDFMDMGVRADVKNTLGTVSEMTILTNDFLQVKADTTSATCIQMRMLPVTDGDSLLCMVRTYAGDIDGIVAESVVELYSQDWKRVQTFVFPLENFIVKPDTISQERFDELRALIDPVMMKAALSSADNDYTLTLNLSTPLVTMEERKQLEAILVQRKLKWDRETFN